MWIFTKVCNLVVGRDPFCGNCVVGRDPGKLRLCVVKLRSVETRLSCASGDSGGGRRSGDASGLRLGGGV